MADQLTVCVVCGDDLKPGDVIVQPNPVRDDDWAHVDPSAPDDDCASRYWDPPEGLESWSAT